jgi:hypothetical protein
MSPLSRSFPAAIPRRGHWMRDEVTERIREAIELCLEVEGVPEQML